MFLQENLFCLSLSLACGEPAPSSEGALIQNKNTPCLAARGVFGASDVTRTRDLLITNQLHYLLCYTSISRTGYRPDKRIIL